MNRSTPRMAPRIAGIAVSAIVLSLGLAACGGDDGDGGDGGSADGPVEITIATFNEFGYEDLITEWNADNPDIQVTQKKIGTWDDAKENLYTKLAAGSGLSDIEAIEGDAMPAMLAESDAFVDLTDPELDGRWLDFKAAAATNADGQMIGYGTDAGPEGICYRSDLFKKAGLPTDREEVAALMGTWDDYFATGEEFVSKVPGTAWYDSTGGTAQAMLNQVENPFEQSDNTIDVENAELAAVYDDLDRERRQGPVHPAHPVERRLDRLLPEGRLRHHGLPRLDARRGLRQRRRRRGLGLRQRLPGRRRQLGRLVPRRAEAVGAPRRGQGVRGLDHGARAAGEGLPGHRGLPEPGRRPATTRPSWT